MQFMLLRMAHAISGCDVPQQLLIDQSAHRPSMSAFLPRRYLMHPARLSAARGARTVLFAAAEHTAFGLATSERFGHERFEPWAELRRDLGREGDARAEGVHKQVDGTRDGAL